jgi:ABC-2 type transport system permease protein
MNDTFTSAPIDRPFLFQSLRRRLLANAARGLLRGSGLRVATIFLLSVLVWACVFTGSWWGLQFLQQLGLPPALLGDIIGTLLDLYFLSLAFMLLFSGGIILYGSLFASAESAFLLSTPAAADRIFAYKYQSALAFSSWAFILLGSPILIAYGSLFHAPWYFYTLLPLFFLGFVLLPGSVGALGCLLIVNAVPRQRKQALAAAVVVLLLLLGLWGFQIVRTARGENNPWTRDAAMHVLSQFGFARGPLFPSHWISQGLQAAAEKDGARGLLGSSRAYEHGALYYLALIWANGLFLYLLTAWAARRLYRRGYNRVATGGSLRRRYGGLWVDHALAGLVFFLDPQIRLLLIKDFRTFRRDPAQWAQILIFTALLALYFVNTRRFYQEEIPFAYQNGVSLLNLSATALLLCAWTGRFVYPLLSLEGRKFWILGLLPLRRDMLLWGKFAFSATGAVLFAGLLVVLSDVMLAMPPQALGLHLLTVTVLATGLSGLSVGVGAWIPNFRESDPSKIAIGFGGTLNLVASLLFLSLVIGLMAAPWHLYVGVGEQLGWDEGALLRWIIGGVVAGILLGVLAVAVPLRVGARSLRRMEF